MVPLIEAHQLSKRYRSTVALADVSFSIPAGAIYALVGANGAGKTTLIKLLLNIIAPSSGHATVLGVPSTRVAGEVFERIGYVSENQEMPESMSVGTFLAYVRAFYPSWDDALETRLVRQFDLPLKRKLKHLSRGMKMKVALASVLAYRPSLIVLDEPFSGLDPFVRDELVEGLLDRGPETAVFLSSHDLFEIESLASHVGYLERGRLMFSEGMLALEDRFRAIEVTLATGPSDPIGAAVQLPAGLPVTWLHPQVTGGVLRFVDSQFSGGTPAELAERFPEASDIAIAPMTLRSIFVSIAKAGRLNASRTSDLGAA
jgi:ABC-2 type transport system ATP-binding protein